MQDLTPMEKAFFDLWNSGYRFLSESDRDSLRYGIYKKENGKVEGYTINGLMKFAEKSKLNLWGEYMTPDEIEVAFNYLKYMRSLKR
jgi:hypothetical protein